MLNPPAKVAATAEEPDGRSVSELVLDGRRWRCVAGTSGHRGPFRRETGLLVPLGAVRRVLPGLFSLRNADRWAAYLGNVGLKVKASAEHWLAGVDIEAATRASNVEVHGKYAQ